MLSLVLQPVNICWLKMNKWIHYKTPEFPQLTLMRNTSQLIIPDGNKYPASNKGPQTPSTMQGQPPLGKDGFFSEFPNLDYNMSLVVESLLMLKILSLDLNS